MTLTRPALAWVFAFALCMPGLGRAESPEQGPMVEDPGTVVPPPGDTVPDPDVDDPDDFHHSAVPEQRLADKFGVDRADIQSLRDEKLGYGEIDHTLTLAERLPGGITDENVATILDQRQNQKMGWGQIAHQQGTTLGQAKKDFPTQPPEEPPPPVTDPTQPAPTTTTAAVQPKSLTRSGKTSMASSGNGGSSGNSGKGASSLSRGGSNRSARTMTASTSPAQGHAYGHGGVGGSSAKANNGNGKAKGHK